VYGTGLEDVHVKLHFFYQVFLFQLAKRLVQEVGGNAPTLVVWVYGHPEDKATPGDLAAASDDKADNNCSSRVHGHQEDIVQGGLELMVTSLATKSQALDLHDLGEIKA